MKKSVAYYVTLLHKDFSNYCSEELQKLGLSQGLLYFILYVGNHQGCSPKELSQALYMDTGHVTRSLSKLEQGGFISQEQNKKDHRAHILKLKEKGIDALRISHELFTNWDNEMMKDMSEDDKTLLLGLLGRLSEGELRIIKKAKA